MRDAIAAANSADTINFDAGLSGQTITLTSGELLINKNLTITGPALGITVSGNASSRVFEVMPSVTVNLNSIRVENGQPVASGGGILNNGTLNLTNSTVANNTGLDFGGGIFNGGTMTLTDTTVSNNLTNGSNLSGGGGGIFSQGPDLTLIRSTVDNNTTQGRGGGIYNLDQGTLLVNSTVSGNHALNGGGIFNRFGTVSLEFSTNAFNTATSTAGGVWNFGNRFTLHNSIDGNNVGPGLTPSDCTGAITDFGFNLASDATCSLSPASRNNAVLNLLPLASNARATRLARPGRTNLVPVAQPSMAPTLASARRSRR